MKAILLGESLVLRLSGPFLLLLILLDAGCINNPVAAQAPVGISEIIRELEEHRTKAEYWASELKRQETKISKQSFRFGKSLYVDAQAAVHGWIKKLQADLKVGNETNEDAYEKGLRDIAVKAQTFMEYVAALAEEDQSRGLGVLIPDIINGFVDAGLKLFREIKATKKEKREALIEILDGLRWKDFREINPT